MSKEHKSFDCVDMKHKASERIRKELEGKSKEERLAYWHEEEVNQRKLQGEAVHRD